MTAIPGPKTDALAELTSVDRLLAPERWPIPAWLDSENRATRSAYIDNFQRYFALRLRIRYLELETDFRSIASNHGKMPDFDLVTAELIANLLTKARLALESKDRNPDLINISSMLQSVERNLVWVTPADFLEDHSVLKVQQRLGALTDEEKQVVTRHLDEAVDALRGGASGAVRVRTVLDTIMELVNARSLEDQINTGLQIQRLASFWSFGIILIIVLVSASPFVSRNTPEITWPSEALLKDADLPAIVKLVFRHLINCGGIALAGAIGGFVSGLLQVRATRIDLVEYQEDRLKLRLKPVLGALLSVVLYILLSWNLLPGVKIENAGTYFMAAFLSGFSERYFFRLIEIKQKSDVGIDGEKQASAIISIGPTPDGPPQRSDHNRIPGSDPES